MNKTVLVVAGFPFVYIGGFGLWVTVEIITGELPVLFRASFFLIAGGVYVILCLYAHRLVNKKKER